MKTIYNPTIRNLVYIPFLFSFCLASTLFAQTNGDNRLAFKLKEAASYSHEDAVSPVVFSPDGRYLASGSEDRTVKIMKITRE